MIIYGNNEMEYLSSKDPVMKELIQHFGHLDRGTTTNIYESLIYHIIGQMLSNRASETITNRFISLVGSVTPDNVIRTDNMAIRKCGISNQKIYNIKTLSKDVIDGKYNFDQLNNMTDDEIIQYLTQIKGVGRWTAEMITEFTLGRLNVFSYDDIALRNGIIKAHGYKTLSKLRFERLRNKYSPYCSVASLYYYSLNDEK